MNFFSLFKRKIIYNLKKKYPVDQDYFQSADLDYLFNHYGSDKAHIFSKTNNTGHGFSNFYEEQLKNWKDKEIPKNPFFKTGHYDSSLFLHGFLDHFDYSLFLAFCSLF